MSVLGGFKCSKNTLIALNAFYIFIGILLISLGSYWSTSNKISSLPIIGGVVASGVFLILISVVGIIGASRHHQVLLFFYMVILFIVFVIQFSVACACLSVSTESQKKFAEQGWRNVGNNTKEDAQRAFECCGFSQFSNKGLDDYMKHPPCFKIEACSHFTRNGSSVICQSEQECCSEFVDEKECGCPTCEDQFTLIQDKAFRVTGGVSLFFSFTEIIGAVFAWRFRNLYANGLSLS